MESEKRKVPRFSCFSPQEYPVDIRSREGAGYLFDFSRDGLSFYSSVGIKEREKHELEIWASALEKPVSCEVRVIWVHYDEGKSNCLCGARILRMDPSTKSDLLDVLYQDWKQKALNQPL